MTASVVEAAAVPAVEAAAAPVGDYARAVEEAIISSQEKLENKSSRNARKRIATMFEDFRNGRNISVALMDDFLHTLERTAGRNGSEKKSASTMWTYRSHLIKYILQHYHVDYSNEGSYRVYISSPFPFCVSLPIFHIKRYQNLLKERSKQHKSNQSLVFEKEALFDWLATAPSVGEVLRDKLVALTCYYGVCRIADIIYLSFDDVHVQENEVVIDIKRAKAAASEAHSRFTIPRSDGCGVVALFKTYIDAQCDKTGRFWHHIRNGRWTTLPVGHNVLAATPERIARALHLENPARYTGHCFRRTSATALANAGATLLELKRAGGWRSDTVCQRYVADSATEQQKTAKMLAPQPAPPSAQHTALPTAPQPAQYTFTNCSNFTIHIHTTDQH
jgi:integrase